MVSRLLRLYLLTNFDKVGMYLNIGMIKALFHGGNKSEFDQEIPQSHSLQINPQHCDEEPQNTNSHKTSGRQLK